MAEEEPLLVSPPTQDVAVHVRDYERFTQVAEMGRADLPCHRLHRPPDPQIVRSMKIAVLKETAGETRCAAIPETVKKFVALGAEVAVEKGAGERASIADADFEAAGAAVGSRADVLKGAGIILCVDGPDPASLKGAENGALLVGALDPTRRREAIDGYAAAGLEALAMEWMPRITRAQSMDIFRRSRTSPATRRSRRRRRLTAAPSR